jgi:hypothetical protein
MQSDKAEFILEHRRSTRRQGIIELLQVVLFLALVFVVYQSFFANWVWKQGNEFIWFVVAIGGLSFLVLLHAAWQIYLNGEFICRIDGRMIESISPDRTAGVTFPAESRRRCQD